MSEQEKSVATKLAEAFEALPAHKKEYMLGFADGVAATKETEPEKEAGR